jgi:hypothetical protein
MAMFAPTIRRSLLEARTTLPPTFLLPFRANLSTVSHTHLTDNTPSPLLQSGHRIPEDQKLAAKAPKTNLPKPPAPETAAIPYARVDVQSTALTPSIRKMLPLLRSQPAHYITIHLHGRPYLVTRGDEIRLPFLMPGVKPGDVLRLNRATHLGSRDYTLKAPEPQKGSFDGPKKMFYLDERLFVCRATVVGVESEPMRVKEKTKRRQRHVRHVFSQHKYTVLKISDLKVRSLEEYEGLITKD